MAVIPPWLNVSPSDFAASARAGLAAGQSGAEEALRLREQGRESDVRASLEAQAQANQAAASVRSAALESQRLQQQKLLAGMETQAREQQAQRDFLLKQQQQKILDAYRQSEIGLRQSELDRSLADNAAKYQDIQGYMAAINSGLDPSQAAAKFPRAVTAGIATQLTKTGTSSTEEGKLSQKDAIDYRNAQSILNSAPTKIATLEANQTADPSTIDLIKQQMKDAKAVVDRINAKSQTQTVTTQKSSGAIPQPAIDYLKAHPDFRDKFDEQFGAGAADRVLGQAPKPAVKAPTPFTYFGPAQTPADEPAQE